MTKFQNDTIVAIITATGSAAIGVIRLSGNQAISIINSVFKGVDLEKQASHTIHFGYIKNEATILDEVLVSIFKAPSSYTKENVVEISCHGSNYILQQVFMLLVSKGARAAMPGEFTQRAYLNGRFDLAQAEAVADIIASDSEAAHKIAMQQMRGGISKKLKALRTSLVEFAALIELELDFAEEDVEFADRTKFNNLLHQILLEIQVLSSSFKYGNAIKKGIKLAIIGQPNAGKSSWINALMNDDIAIVSDIAGTTRDKIETTLDIQGVLFRLIDTAGIRETEDTIEKIGVQRALETIENADIVMYIFDIINLTIEDIQKDLKLIHEKTNAPVLIIANKADLINEQNTTLKSHFQHLKNLTFLSAKNNIDIEKAKESIYDLALENYHFNSENVIISNNRHYEALKNAETAIVVILEQLDLGISTDFIAQDIKTALRYLGDITGNIDVDRDILGTIFSKFCIGK